ncbi:MAG: hypothetical protein V3T86_05680 [Planctomycetota bacterium]
MRVPAAVFLLTSLAAAADKLDSPIVKYHSIDRAVREYEREVERQQEARVAFGAAERGEAPGTATVEAEPEAPVEDTTQSESFAVEIDVGVWYPKLAGPVRVDGDKVFDAGEFLTGTKYVAVPTVRATMNWHDFVVIVDAAFAEFSGTVVLDGDVPLPDNTILPVDTAARTRLQFTLSQILLGHHFHAAGRVDFRVLGGVALYNIEGRIWTDAHTGIRFDQLIPLPLIGFEVRGHFGNTRFVWEIFLVGFGLDVTVLGGRTTDFRASLGYRLSRRAFLRLGYRYMDIVVEVSSIDLAVTIEGPMLELEVRF